MSGSTSITYSDPIPVDSNKSVSLLTYHAYENLTLIKPSLATDGVDTNYFYIWMLAMGLFLLIQILIRADKIKHFKNMEQPMVSGEKIYPDWQFIEEQIYHHKHEIQYAIQFIVQYLLVFMYFYSFVIPSFYEKRVSNEDTTLYDSTEWFSLDFSICNDFIVQITLLWQLVSLIFDYIRMFYINQNGPKHSEYHSKFPTKGSSLWIKEQSVLRLVYIIGSLFAVNILINFAINNPDYFPYFPMILYGVLLILRRTKTYWILNQGRVDFLAFTDRSVSSEKSLLDSSGRQSNFSDYNKVEQNALKMIECADNHCFFLKKQKYGDQIKLPQLSSMSCTQDSACNTFYFIGVPIYNQHVLVSSNAWLQNPTLDWSTIQYMFKFEVIGWSHGYYLLHVLINVGYLWVLSLAINVLVCDPDFLWSFGFENNSIFMTVIYIAVFLYPFVYLTQWVPFTIQKFIEHEHDNLSVKNYQEYQAAINSYIYALMPREQSLQYSKLQYFFEKNSSHALKRYENMQDHYHHKFPNLNESQYYYPHQKPCMQNSLSALFATRAEEIERLDYSEPLCLISEEKTKELSQAIYSKWFSEMAIEQYQVKFFNFKQEREDDLDQIKQRVMHPKIGQQPLYKVE